MLNSTVHAPLNSTAANINNSFEIIALQFRDNVEFVDQEATMANLNTVVKNAAVELREV
jgi:hypothetical protein